MMRSNPVRGDVNDIQTLMRALLEEVRNNSSIHAVTQSKLEDQNENIDTLMKIVRDGDGQPSLISRGITLELGKAGNSADEKRGWVIATILISGLLSIVGSVVTALLILTLGI